MTTTRVRPESAPAMEQLPVPPLRTSREIQGNVLAAFNKDYMAFRYMQFSEDKTLARGWLSAILNTVSVTADVEDFNEEFSLGRRAYGRDPDKQATWVGVSLTYAGLSTVVDDAKQLEADLKNFPQFVKGAAASAGRLGDTGDSDPENWLFGSPGTGAVVHAVLLVASDSKAALDAKLLNIEAADGAHRVTLVHQDDGETLPGDLKGHEHFGYKDGISQPGVRDFHREDPGNAGHRDNRPGAKLLAPGEFVFGYDTEPHSTHRTGPAWMKDGSLQVVRRLSQDVLGWRKAVTEQTRNFQPGLTAEELGACLVGRELDGTPLAKPSDPLKGLGGDANDFDYANDTRGGVTPCAAHIRRTYPRAGMGERGSKVESHRLMRRGIPYGPVVEEDAAKDRGLMFVCYGTSLDEQFEFVQADWSNAKGFVPGDPTAPNCIDKVTGPEGGGRIELDRGPKGDINMAQFVTTKGMVYAFTPSLTTLRHLAAGDPLPRS
ncbi:Dyp-type peroxidase [Streptomyces sioyaensis]|uniref:Dyp-type peroxidase n=1 Tax=Streptomyces sioyaensis TaxID=67364 RepID=UPI0037977244